MLKLNVSLGRNKRLVLMGITDKNLAFLAQDRPIAFAANEIMVHGVQGVQLIGVNSVGHFLDVVAPGLAMDEELQQKFIDAYRYHARDKKAGQWFPWMMGSGVVSKLSTDIIAVACGFLVAEAAVTLKLGQVLKAPGGTLGLRAWDQIGLFYAPTSTKLQEVLVTKVLPGYDAQVEVIKGVEEYLRTQGPGSMD